MRQKSETSFNRESKRQDALQVLTKEFLNFARPEVETTQNAPRQQQRRWRCEQSSGGQEMTKTPG